MAAAKAATVKAAESCALTAIFRASSIRLSASAQDYTAN